MKPYTHLTFIEPLEARIAPASVTISTDKFSATYSDVDGDLVTIKYSAPVANQIGYQFNLPPSIFGSQLTGLDFTPAIFPAGMSVTITAKPQLILPGGTLHGDGLANVGFFNALNDDLGAVSVAGDVAKIRAGSGSATIPAIKSLKVQSLDEYGLDTGAPNINTVIRGGLGSLTVKGNLRGNLTATIIGPVTIGGSVIGVGIGDGEIFGTDGIGNVKIGGNLEGVGQDFTGSLQTMGTAKIGDVTIGGSILGGSFPYSGFIHAGGGLGAVKIGGNIAASTGSDGSGAFSARIESSGAIKSVTLGGSLIGGFDPNPADATVVGEGSGAITSSKTIGALKIGRDVVGGTGLNTGYIESDGAISSVRIGGSLLGGGGTASGLITSLESIGQIVIGGDLRGGSPVGAYAVSDAGAIEVRHLGSLTVGGSIMAGHPGSGTLSRSGFVNATDDIGAVVVKGSLLGNADVLVMISARGAFGLASAQDVAIKSLTVSGRVDHAWILGGVDSNSAGVDGDAQIGAVSVRGDWIGSVLATGITSTDGVLGDGNDARIGAGTTSKIASIVIGGQVVGDVGTNNTSGFAAERIVSFKYNGLTVHLDPNAGDDTFASNNAHPVGPSRSTVNGDGYAVHVYEVGL